MHSRQNVGKGVVHGDVLICREIREAFVDEWREIVDTELRDRTVGVGRTRPHAHRRIEQGTVDLREDVGDNTSILRSTDEHVEETRAQLVLLRRRFLEEIDEKRKESV